LLVFFIPFLLFIILFLLDGLTSYLKLLLSCFLPLNVSRPDVKVPFVLLDRVMPEEFLEMLLDFQLGLF